MLGMQMKRRTFWLGMHGPSIPQQPAAVTQDLSAMAVVVAAVYTINYHLWVIDSNLGKLIQYIFHCKLSTNKNALLSECTL